MKKFLLSLAAIALGFNAYAEVVTFDFVTNDYGLERKSGSDQDGYLPMDQAIYSGNVEIVLGGTEAGNRWRLWTDGLREYSKGSPTFKVSTTDGQPVTYVSWTLKSPGVTVSVDGKELTSWSGSAESVLFQTAASSNIAFQTITVAYGEAYTPDEPEPDQPDPDEPDTEIHEFTVPEALAFLAEGKTGTAIVSGIVSEVKSYNSTYGSITYYITDSPTSSQTLQIYSGLGLDGKKFTSKNDILVGAEVQVKGTLKMYNSEPEMAQENILISYKVPDDVDVPNTPAAPQGTITVDQAINDYILEGYDGPAVVKGYIAAIDEINLQYGNATYVMVDTMEPVYKGGLTVYRGYYLDGEKFTSEDQLEVGAFVVVSGSLTYYNNTTPEITTGNKILEYHAPGEVGVASIFSDSKAPTAIYNLQGVKVANPVKGGIYIVNGKKVIF